MSFTGRLLLSIRCRDRVGIVANVTRFLADRGLSISEAHQHESLGDGLFFMRISFYSPEGGTLDLADLCQAFGAVAQSLDMDFTLRDLGRKQRLLLLVSKAGHCLHDLVHRWQEGHLPAEIAGVVSNHETLRSFSEWAGLPFHHLPVTAKTRVAQERQLLDLVESLGVDLVVLARYMQILSPALCRELEGRCINIHHSFLPSFKGARPYHQAHARGVKLIGATAHYVTTDLDEGPIIEQEVRRVTHRRSPDDLVALGQEVESSVLARAVRWHCEGRIFLNGNRTLIFD